ncbi:DNA-directed RNA polymerase subunit H [Candidatus Woesearchaeota archaeon]|nr:DNA-directed RNA polymerase subunit H [Candidatus Woesearchaeota archaeon]
MDKNIDITQHVLVPKHTMLSPEESKKLLSDLNIISSQLPKILKSDAAIKHLNLEPGEIIEIERVSPTAGRTKFYRVVING